MRFDVPVVGLSTLAVMAKVGAAVLSLDANRALVLDGARFFTEANAKALTVVGRDRQQRDDG